MSLCPPKIECMQQMELIPGENHYGPRSFKVEEHSASNIHRGKKLKLKLFHLIFFASPVDGIISQSLYLFFPPFQQLSPFSHPLNVLFRPPRAAHAFSI